MASLPHPPRRPPGSDDEVITQALRRSLVALVVLCLVAGTAVWWLQRRPEAKPTALAFQMRPSAHKARALVRQGRQFHLQHAFTRARTVGENL